MIMDKILIYKKIQKNAFSREFIFILKNCLEESFGFFRNHSDQFESYNRKSRNALYMCQHPFPHTKHKYADLGLVV